MEGLKIFGDLGKIVVTERVLEALKVNSVVYKVFESALTKYILCDWGFTDDEYEKGNFPVNSEHNNAAVESGEGIVMAIYMQNWVKINKELNKPIRNPEMIHPIWIVTEADRSKTTIMFPDEY